MIGTHGPKQPASLWALVTTSMPLLAACAGLTLGSRAMAGDWPQILGPQRSGQASDDERLADAWPAGGPPIRWQRNVGSGFSGIAVGGGKAVLFHRTARQQVVEALDPNSGKTLWTIGFATNYSPRFTADDGPRCVPLIYKNHVYLFGAEGDLICLTLDRGRKVWHRTLHRDYQVTEGYFGAGSTPIIESDRLLVNVGGRNGAGIVAISLADGKTIWKATDERASYASPVAAEVDGVLHVIFATRLSVISINPADGSTRFSYPFGKRGLTVTGASPVICGARVFTSASYDIGSTMAKVSPQGYKQLASARVLESTTRALPALADGLLYLRDSKTLKCLEVGAAKNRKR